MKPLPGTSGSTIEPQRQTSATAPYDHHADEKSSPNLSMENTASRPIAAPLAHRVPADADVSRIADAVVATWQELDGALTPIVGARGFAALYKRSVYVAALRHPWLIQEHDNALATVNLSDLNSVFKQQSPAEASASAAILFETFHDLLVSMVGPSLTERLLRSVWFGTSSAPTAKDPTT